MTKTMKVAIGLVGLMAVFQFFNRAPSVDPAVAARKLAGERQQDLERDARFACQDAVRAMLKAPKTADFDDMRAGPDKQNGAHLIVLGQVSAQNSFGALLTKNLGCVWDTVTKALMGNPLVADR